jgi:hypothetical protein
MSTSLTIEHLPYIQCEWERLGLGSQCERDARYSIVMSIDGREHDRYQSCYRHRWLMRDHIEEMGRLTKTVANSESSLTPESE